MSAHDDDFLPEKPSATPGYEVLPKAVSGVKGGPKRQPVRWAAAITAGVAWVVALIEWLTSVDVPTSIEAGAITLVAAIFSGIAAQGRVTPSFDEGDAQEDAVDLSMALEAWHRAHPEAQELTPEGLVAPDAAEGPPGAPGDAEPPATPPNPESGSPPLYGPLDSG